MQKKMTFKDLINGDKPVLVDFFAPWCGPCKAMNPILKEVAGKVGEKGSIVKIDVDRNQQLAAQLGIYGVPTFIMYKKGKEVWRKSGMVSGNVINKAFNKNS